MKPVRVHFSAQCCFTPRQVVFSPAIFLPFENPLETEWRVDGKKSEKGSPVQRLSVLENDLHHYQHSRHVCIPTEPVFEQYLHRCNTVESCVGR